MWGLSVAYCSRNGRTIGTNPLLARAWVQRLAIDRDEAPVGRTAILAERLLAGVMGRTIETARGAGQRRPGRSCLSFVLLSCPCLSVLTLLGRGRSLEDSRGPSHGYFFC